MPMLCTSCEHVDQSKEVLCPKCGAVMRLSLLPVWNLGKKRRIPSSSKRVNRLRGERAYSRSRSAYGHSPISAITIAWPLTTSPEWGWRRMSRSGTARGPPGPRPRAAPPAPRRRRGSPPGPVRSPPARSRAGPAGARARGAGAAFVAEVLQCALAGLGRDGDLDPAGEPGDELFELLDLFCPKALAPAAELEPRNILDRQLPARPGVLEGADLELELAPHPVHADHRHRRAAGIEHAGTAARDQVGERPRLEILVSGGVGIVLVDGVGRGRVRRWGHRGRPPGALSGPGGAAPRCRR